MCRLRNIAMCDYKESVTTGQTDTRTDRQTPDKVIPMCHFASQATQKVDWHNRETNKTITVDLSFWSLKYNRQRCISKINYKHTKIKTKHKTGKQMLLLLVIICLPRTSGIHYSLNGLWSKDQRSLIVNLIKSHRHIDRTTF